MPPELERDVPALAEGGRRRIRRWGAEGGGEEKQVGENGNTERSKYARVKKIHIRKNRGCRE